MQYRREIDGLRALAVVPVSAGALAWGCLALSVTGMLFGGVVLLLAGYATVHPIGQLRDGLADIAAGRLDTRLEVWDGTEIGQLQAGFNEMAEGLRERERIQELFGRQVGADVARHTVAGNVALGGSTVEAAVVFVDLVGSTALASALPPQSVLAVLNRFFAEVVDVVERHGGWINKFQGDAALAVFGAPVALEDGPTRALRCARLLHERLAGTAGIADAGIGVAAGTVVAGHLGAEQRFEYTVIGDPVNQAARLTELAKRCPGRVLATGDAVARAGTEEASRWTLGQSVVLRGRGSATRLAYPIEVRAVARAS